MHFTACIVIFIQLRIEIIISYPLLPPPPPPPYTTEMDGGWGEGGSTRIHVDQYLARREVNGKGSSWAGRGMRAGGGGGEDGGGGGGGYR